MFFDYPYRLIFLFLLVPLIVFFFFDRLNRSKLFKWYPVNKKRLVAHLVYYYLGFTFTCATLVFMIFAFAAPYTDKKETKKQKVQGEEILFLVDVSKSMLAQDVVPSRLEKVKYDIIEFASHYKGAKMGLIAFAGDAVIKSPMTTDSFFFTTAVQELNVNSVSRGSTSLTSALQTTLKMLPQGESGSASRNLIIFTDGEDHEDNPLPIAQKVEEAGGRILFIAIGNKEIGGRIPIMDENGNASYLVDDGQEIWSKPDIVSLKRITESCKNSALVPVFDGHYLLKDHYDAFNSKMGGATKTTQEGEVQIDVEYQISFFVLLSLLSLICSMLFFQLAQWRFQFEN